MERVNRFELSTSTLARHGDSRKASANRVKSEQLLTGDQILTQFYAALTHRRGELETANINVVIRGSASISMDCPQALSAKTINRWRASPLILADNHVLQAPCVGTLNSSVTVGDNLDATPPSNELARIGVELEFTYLPNRSVQSIEDSLCEYAVTMASAALPVPHTALAMNLKLVKAAA